MGICVQISSIYGQLSALKVLRKMLGCVTNAARAPSGIDASTVLISAGPRPVTVRLCFGLLTPGGPTGPAKSESGAEVDGLRSLVEVVDAMLGAVKGR